MTKNEMITIIKNELTTNPQATSMGISKKYKIPFKLVQVFKVIISRDVP